MNKQVINPWSWQEPFGFVQGVEISAMERILVCSGQTSVNEEGYPLHAGNMVAQLNKSFDNLETILHQAGFALSDIIQLKYYTTDVTKFSQAMTEIVLPIDGNYTSTLLGVTALFHPDIMVEIEALAVK